MEPTQDLSQLGKVNLKDAQDIKCPECDGLYFQSVMAFKEVPALLSGNKKPTLVPLEIFRCTDCGTPLKKLLPKFDNEIIK
jgi:DNA-directed RNA polymerase subunit RPC12/RpoP